MVQKAWLAGMAVAAMAGGLAACGGDDDGGSATAGPSAGGGAATTAAPKGKPIKIGTIAPTSGPYGLPDLVASVKGAIEGINARGGIAGRPVEFVLCDEGNDPNKAAACARKLISEGVVAEVSGSSVTAEQQIGKILSAAGVAQVGDSASGGSFDRLETEFLLYGGSITPQAIGTVKMCADQGHKKLGTPNLAVPSTIAIGKDVKRAADALGLQVVSSPSISLTQTDFTPVAQVMANKGVDCITAEIPPNQVIALLKSNQTLGKKVQLNLNAQIMRPDDLKALGGLGNGMGIVASYPVPTDTEKFPVFKRYQEDMERTKGDGAPAGDPNASDGSINGWFAVQAVAKMLEGSGVEPTAKGVLAALKAAEDVDLGLPTKWSPNTPGPAGHERVWNGVVYPHIVEDGKLTEGAPAFDALDAG